MKNLEGAARLPYQAGEIGAFAALAVGTNIPDSKMRRCNKEENENLPFSGTHPLVDIRRGVPLTTVPAYRLVLLFAIHFKHPRHLSIIHSVQALAYRRFAPSELNSPAEPPSATSIFPSSHRFSRVHYLFLFGCARKVLCACYIRRNTGQSEMPRSAASE